jgi:hypothetical protein
MANPTPVVITNGNGVALGNTGATTGSHIANPTPVVVTSATGTPLAPVDIPKIVAKVSLTGQTEAIAETTIYTPPSPGTYRVSCTLHMQVASSAGTIQPGLTYNNGTQQFGGFGLSSALNATSLASWLSAVTVIHCASSPIKYRTAFSGVTGSPQYTLDFVVEQLA